MNRRWILKANSRRTKLIDIGGRKCTITRIKQGLRNFQNCFV